MATSRNRPTKLELAILRVLRDSGPFTSRDVQSVLSRTHPAGYTTVLKMLQIMTEKELLSRSDSARLRCSVKTMVMQALATRKSSAKDLEAIEQLLDRLEGDSK